MSQFTYYFDELKPWPDLAVYCYGEAVITYRWVGRDRDTGEWPGPEDIEIQSISLDAPLDRAHPLYDLIEAQLNASDHVTQACIDDYES